MPRLLFVTERFPPDLGGVARSADRITVSLAQLGVEVNVLTWSRYLQPGEVKTNAWPLNDRFTSPEATAISVHRIGLYRQWDRTMLHTLTVLEWLHQTQPYDLVWGHYVFPAGFLAVWFAVSQSIPSVVSARGNDIDREMFPPGDFARLQWTLTNANVITAVTQDLQTKIQRLTRREDVVVLPNTVDTDLFQPAPFQLAPTGVDPSIAELKRSLDMMPDERVLGFSGELREKKGYPFLLKALKTVQTDFPACLLLIGELRDTEAATFQRYVQHSNGYPRVIITGHLSDPALVAQHLHLCDVYLQPSLWEGLPNALLEAMACGLGCIASDAGGIPEVIEHGKTGFLVPRFYLHQLGEAVLEWFSLDTEMRYQIGQQARDRMVKFHSLAQEQDRLKTLVDRVLGR